MPSAAPPATFLDLPWERTCACPAKHLSCIPPKEWMKSQLGVWRFAYEKRDVRDKRVHPAAFPIALARRAIDLFTHRGELVLDPFAGSGTTLVAARDAGRNAAGFDLQNRYVKLCEERLNVEPEDGTAQRPVCADARSIPAFLEPGRVKLLLTSPPYANLLNRPRKNKSRRTYDRRNAQLGKVEQYSQDARDLGTLDEAAYGAAMESVFRGLLPLLQPKAHCVVNVPDMWWNDRRVTLHIVIVEALRRAGYELRNIIIWDRTNIVNRVGIFGWPSNYITMGVTFEYLLDFRRPVTNNSQNLL
ncbi:MAG: site-specific DNA-methyltransferase [Planctomycetes bacterium]|nr:site-specific DNA-methyltransferase [Planctomycetota bacterium]